MKDILKRELDGETISPNDPDFKKIHEIILNAFDLTDKLNSCGRDTEKISKIFNELLGYEVDSSNTIIPPFYTDFGRNTKLGKNCFIQQCCTFFDRGGITIGNNVFIGPKVNLITLNHDINPNNRNATIAKPIIIKDNVWIGINSTILPGITIGENSIVGAGSVITHDVPDNTVVAGNPAKIIKKLEDRKED